MPCRGLVDVGDCHSNDVIVGLQVTRGRGGDVERVARSRVVVEGACSRDRAGGRIDGEQAARVSLGDGAVHGGVVHSRWGPYGRSGSCVLGYRASAGARDVEDDVCHVQEVVPRRDVVARAVGPDPELVRVVGISVLRVLVVEPDVGHRGVG